MSDPASQPQSGIENPSTSEDTTTATTEGAVAPLSKKAQKKAAKTARFAAQKLERRAREKEARKEKKLKRAAQEHDRGDTDEAEGASARKRPKVDKPVGPVVKFGARLVIDLGFDDKMTDKIVSLTSQLAYSYSVNRKAVRPFEHLLFTSLNGKTLARLENLSDAGYKRWVGTEWWSDSYERLWNDKEPELDADRASETLTTRLGPKADRQSVVYLTADSSEELTELKEGETYVIGGICDHNRYKVRIQLGTSKLRLMVL